MNGNDTERLIIDNDKPLTKKQIYQLIANNMNISEPIIRDIFAELTKLLYSELDRCGEFRFFDLGKLKVKHVNARIGVDPSTGQKRAIKARTKLRFSFSKQCKEFANTLYV